MEENVVIKPSLWVWHIEEKAPSEEMSSLNTCGVLRKEIVDIVFLKPE